MYNRFFYVLKYVRLDGKFVILVCFGVWFLFVFYIS